jgi:hypothetical protein
LLSQAKAGDVLFNRWLAARNRPRPETFWFVCSERQSFAVIARRQVWKYRFSLPEFVAVAEVEAIL